MSSDSIDADIISLAIDQLTELEIPEDSAIDLVREIYQPGMTVEDIVEKVIELMEDEEDDSSNSSEKGSSSSDTSFDGEPLKLMLCVRTDLGMSVGKIAAQVGHGVHSVCREGSVKLLSRWEASTSAKIVVELDSLSTLFDIKAKAEAKQIPVYLVTDAGRTEIEPGTVTVMAIGPGTSEQLKDITGSLKLLK
jgi:peptidyl-tRNA hydrolase, PTH2 family